MPTPPLPLDSTNTSTPAPTPPPGSRHCGIVAIVGRANVGKSTLINALVGEKISIVSPIAQTTRNMIRGILTQDRGQLVFMDTPGMHKAEHDLGRLMNRMARAAAEGTDIVMLVFDASSSPRVEDDGWMRKLAAQPLPLVIVLNKQDLIAAKPISDQREQYRALWKKIMTDQQVEKPALWIDISAKDNQGLETLLTLLFKSVPEGPLLFPEETLSDFPRKLAMADVVREKLCCLLHEELPYSVAIHIHTIDETDAGLKVAGHVYVNKESQKAIVIGKNGRILKQARIAAQRELTQIYEKPVALRLWVSVQKEWAKNPAFLRQLGYME